ncbi:type II secretion system protein [Anaerorhabdus sp.]|uniref:type II secretion system protein n=1 Tax=Anaerorhabdus sp. TaxID=1872524 RepID=UPI002FCBE4D6
MTKKGFTLIEVIVAVGILAVISILFVTVFAKMTSVNMANKKMNDASLQGQTAITNQDIEYGEVMAPLQFGSNTFTVSPKVCRPNVGRKFVFFRIVD